MPEHAKYDTTPLTVRAWRVARAYPANEQNYDQVEDCGHEWGPRDDLDNVACVHCGRLEA